MFSVLTTEIFDRWFERLGDQRAKARILARTRRITLGNLGDWKPVGARVGELRIDYGPGYRLYFTRRGSNIVILLAGGDKSSQARDIQMAVDVAQNLPSEDLS